MPDTTPDLISRRAAAYVTMMTLDALAKRGPVDEAAENRRLYWAAVEAYRELGGCRSVRACQ